jgi:hypothetical protein
MTRDHRGWSDADIDLARSLRAQKLPWAEIGKRLGGRSDQSVRLKLFEERRAAARGTPANPRGWTREDREAFGPAPIANQDARLVRACRRTGGFTAYSTFNIRKKLWGFCLPMIGAGGIARPAGWKDGTEPENMDAAGRTHLEALRKCWRG